MVVGPLTYDGTVEVLRLELHLLQERGPCEAVASKGSGLHRVRIFSVAITDEVPVLCYTVMLAAH